MEGKIALEKIGYVYVVEDKKRGLCKIGRSKDWNKRIKNIISSSGVDDSRFFVSEKVKNCFNFERKIHEYFKSKRLKGEWFSACFDEIVEYIKNNQEEISKEEYDTAVFESEESSKKVMVALKGLVLGHSNINNIGHDFWIFTKDTLPKKELQQILVDLYPASGVHSYEVLEYIDEKSAFCSFSGDEIEPVPMDLILCWKPITPPPCIKKDEEQDSAMMGRYRRA